MAIQRRTEVIGGETIDIAWTDETLTLIVDRSGRRIEVQWMAGEAPTMAVQLSMFVPSTPTEPERRSPEVRIPERGQQQPH